MKFNCEGSVNAIAVNKDCSFVVAVGRAGEHSSFRWVKLGPVVQCPHDEYLISY